MVDLGLTSLAHIAIRARDLENLVSFYTEKVGLREMFRLNHDNGSLMLVYLRITDDQYLEIFPNGVGETPERNAVGMTHLCLSVADIEKSVAELERAGVTIDVALKTGLDHNRQAWISDPEGNRIELMEMAANSLQSQAIARLKQG